MKRIIISQDCNWNAATLAYPVNPDALTAFVGQLLNQNARVALFDIPNRGVLMVSWKRPDAC